MSALSLALLLPNHLSSSCLYGHHAAWICQNHCLRASDNMVLENDNLSATRATVRRLCRLILGRMPTLKHVSLRLLHGESQIDYTILGPFRVLRNLRSVTIHGVPQSYAEHLRGLMCRNTSHNDLQGMFYLLRECVWDLNGDYLDLDDALKALHD